MIEGMSLDKEWMQKSRTSDEYVDGVDNFLKFAFNAPNVVKIKCPCRGCDNVLFHTHDLVRLHLFRNGIIPTYTQWCHHGEDEFVDSENTETCGVSHGDITDDNMMYMLEDACGVRGFDFDRYDEFGRIGDEGLSVPVGEDPCESAASFFRLLKEYREPLSADLNSGLKVSKLDYMVKMLHLKCQNHWSDASFTRALQLQKESFGANIPGSYYEARKVITDLGLNYVKIDVCINGCILFRGEYKKLDICPICNSCRWKEKSSGKGRNVPHKVLRHFPLKSRLQRLYMSRKTAKDMRWHKACRPDDEIMRHPADSLA